jgi:signal transduction histidine kinase/putative methionine-R-sulfoxide reductase with GAF domain
VHLDGGRSPKRVRSKPAAPARDEAIASSLIEAVPDRALVRAEGRIQQLEDEIADLRAELERSERRVAAMKQIGRVLGSNLALEPLLNEIVARTTDILDADRSTLYLIDHERRELVSTIMQGSELQQIRLPFGTGLAAWVAERGEPLHIQNAYADQRFNPEFDQKSGYRTRCMLVWPVRRPRGDQVTGVIQVLNKRKGAFDSTDERLLEAIASEIGVALEVARLYGEALGKNEALERVRAELMLLIETERAISESKDLETLLGRIIETARTNLRARSGVIWLLDDRGYDLFPAAAVGDGELTLRKLEPSSHDPILSEAMLSAQPVINNDPGSLRRGKIRVRRVLATPIITKEGTMGVIELLNRRGKPFRESDAQTLAVVASQAGRAIRAERERKERERGERLTAIGRMLSGVVHDLRTPLTLIGGYTELMAASTDGEERQKHARSVQKQIELMTTMTRDLLAFARGEQSVLIRKVYVERFMAEMEEYLQSELNGSGVSLKIDVAYRGTARFDESKLRRVFHNIARNAREAMPGGGEFHVTATKVGKDLVFEFADTGLGISKEVEGRVFEPFVTAGKANGTGLGLAMVKRIADEHRGTVAFESAPYKGTKFTFALPMGV